MGIENFITYASTTNAWDYINRLTSTHSSSSPTTFYGYDHTTQRVFRGDGTATSTFANRYYNYKTTGATTTATTTKHVFTPSGELIATIETVGATTTKKYIHTDHLGGTNVVSDENGDVDQTLDYYPFGSDRISTGNTNEQRTFIGEEYDEETELNYLNTRYYDSSRGQFMSQDSAYLAIGSPELTEILARANNTPNSSFRSPEADNSVLQAFLSDPQLQNSYSYARNNPLRYSDPNGELPVIPLILAVYGASQFMIDLGHAANMNIIYGDVTTPEEKFEANSRLAVNLFLNATGAGAARAGMTGVDVAINGLSAGLDVMQHYFGNQIYRNSNLNKLQSIPSTQGRQGFVQSYNSSMGYSTGGGGSAPSNNSLWTTPSGAVVTFGGQLVAPPPSEE